MLLLHNTILYRAMVGNLNFSAWFVKRVRNICAWKGKLWNKNGILK